MKEATMRARINWTGSDKRLRSFYLRLRHAQPDAERPSAAREFVGAHRILIHEYGSVNR